MAALDWYRDVFDATEVLRYTGDDGRIGHAELRVGTAVWYLADEYPEIDVTGPATLGGTTVALHLSVDDVDATYQRAVDGGARSLQPPADQPHGSRHGTIVDPFGHRWMLSTPIAQPTIDEVQAETEGFTITGERDR